jgi:hypothetical protein
VKKIKPAIHTAMLNRVVDFLAATIVSAAIAAGYGSFARRSPARQEYRAAARTVRAALAAS